MPKIDQESGMADPMDYEPKRGAKRREIDRLLDLAEQVESRAESLNQRIYIFYVVSLAYLVGGGYFAYYFANKVTDKAEWLLPVATLVGVVFVAIGVFPLLNRLQRRRRAELRALDEVLSLLRETESALAKEQGWSTLERAEFRIRLSRFGIRSKDWFI